VTLVTPPQSEVVESREVELRLKRRITGFVRDPY
jgi:hypothetical protein